MMKRFIPVLLVLLSSACAAVIPQPVKIEGTAMAPALNDGDRVIIDRNFDKIERGDIIIFYYPEDPARSYIKRVIGLPREKIEIRDGQTFVNGNPIDEPYVDPKRAESKRSLREIELDGDSYFVMGDNRDNSSDSRLWGPLHRKFIYGKYAKKYYSAGS